MSSYQKAPQKGITKLQYFLRVSVVLFLFQLTIYICKLSKQKRGWDKRSRPHFLLAIKL